MTRRARPGSRIGEHRYGLVLGAALANATFSLLAGDAAWTRAVSLLAAGATLGIGVVTSQAPPRTRHALAVALGVLVLAVAVADIAASPGPAIVLALTSLLCATTIAVIAGGLVRLVIERGVVLQAVLGAVAVYLLVGLTFAFLVGTLATGLHGPYFVQTGDAGQSRRTYFSFTTMTTTGFGDLTPAAAIGRTLAVLEMLIGQLYLVTVISLLVGNLGRRRRAPD